MPKNRINSKVVKILDEWTDFSTNKHYLFMEIKGNFILTEITLDWKK